MTHNVLSVVVHPEISELEENDGLNFLTHSVKEELTEMKDSLVLSVRPEQRMP